MSESLVDARRVAEERLGVRKLAHKKLDEVLDMYFAGHPLWIVTDAAWTTRSCSDRLSITIREEYL